MPETPETPEQEWERLRESVQESILRNYPNPKRKGCPGDAVVREVAERVELVTDAPWQHITHCSPCYAEFLRYKDAARRRRRRRRLVLLIGAAIVVVASLIAWITSRQP